MDLLIPRMLSIESEQIRNIVATADENRRSLMNIFRHNIEDRVLSIDGHPARAFNDIRKRIAFVQQA